MGVLPRPPGRTLGLDGLVALPLGAVMVYGSVRAAAFQSAGRRPLDGFAFGLIVLAAAALAGRRSAPLPVLAAVTALGMVYLALGYPYGPIFFAPIVMLLPWLVGVGLRAHTDSIRRAREEEARRLAYEERLRIARDVHDVVGHGLAVINMQAGVALHVVERRPEHARVALEAIKQTSKDALDELRATLAVFRSAGDDRRPPPGLSDVHTVIATMAESGLAVDLVVTGRPAALPAAVDLAAYRIVQESLTNVVRHASAPAATVRVSYEPRMVELEIMDAGRGRPNGQPTGNGIAGMRERAAAVAGESLLSPTVTRRVIAELAGRPPRRTSPFPSLDPLTVREREVVALVAEGLSNDEIAERLVLSPATVRTHVGRAMSKLDARDRAQLVVMAYQSGLASPLT